MTWNDESWHGNDWNGMEMYKEGLQDTNIHILPGLWRLFKIRTTKSQHVEKGRHISWDKGYTLPSALFKGGMPRDVFVNLAVVSGGHTR